MGMAVPTYRPFLVLAALGWRPRGREAVRRLLADGAAAGLVPPVSRLDFID